MIDLSFITYFLVISFIQIKQCTLVQQSCNTLYVRIIKQINNYSEFYIFDFTSFWMVITTQRKHKGIIKQRQMRTIKQVIINPINPPAVLPGPISPEVSTPSEGLGEPKGEASTSLSHWLNCLKSESVR